MRCRIEQRTVIKNKPETKCHRIPREFCHKEDCKEADEDEVQNQNNSAESDDSLHPKCYFRQQIVSDNLTNILKKWMETKMEQTMKQRQVSCSTKSPFSLMLQI